MKSIISLFALASVAFFAQAQTLEDVYKKVCSGEAYTETAADGTTSTNTYYQPWEALLGYALGTQADSTDVDSTCYGQVEETYKFIDTFITEGYDIVNNFDINTISARVQKFAQNANNFVIQLSDQNIACQDSVKVKQLATRTSKVSGLFNWIFTIIYGLTFDDYIKPNLGFLPVPATNQKLKSGVVGIYNQLNAFFNQGTVFDCH